MNQANDFYFRYSLYKTPSQFNTSGGLQTISSSNNFNNHDYTAAAQWSHIVNARALNELRFGTLRRIFDRPPVSGTVGPVISIRGVATLGSNTSANQHYEEDQYNFIDDFSYTSGRHQLRFGADIDTIHVLSIDRLTDTYSFSNLAQYLGAVNGTMNPATGRIYNYNLFTQQFGDNTAEHRTTPINLYAQDHWSGKNYLRHKLSRSAGGTVVPASSTFGTPASAFNSRQATWGGAYVSNSADLEFLVLRRRYVERFRLRAKSGKATREPQACCGFRRWI